ADREATGDPRPSIDERYASREEYLRRVRAAAQELIAAGYVLGEDLPRLVAAARLRYDAFRHGK
ncbi:MAG: alpha/beta hydrolase domain-containing protein, partial [Candidatus Tectomicrobia bacterium]|nr:alpha/beta hydrolase domain-containing protein [Candidatus Tectomicrobia bacterium]